MIAKLIWNKRNDFVFGKGFSHPNQLINRAKRDLDLFNQIQRQPDGVQGTKDQAAVKWIRLPKDWYKLNWDAALSDTRGRLGVGGILRNSDGQMVGTIQAQRHLRLDAFSGEAYAMMVCVNFCREMEVNRFILEGDALRVVKLLSGAQEDWSYGGLIIKEAKMLLNRFTEWHAVHTKREGNKAAHVLAKGALSLNEDVYDFEEVPLCVQHVVASDML
ncbi:uncharacterized protein LOC122289224 [Carya illinoinensis]|uniref:uncharacterized protein LOC122289224 n=1 Tax=Carya illinoinensis TaxID=32201 RepID=UPI001C71B1B4|nr:uncharacterized protein LOC122289224 [Carya illinoinensis]